MAIASPTFSNFSDKWVNQKITFNKKTDTLTEQEQKNNNHKTMYTKKYNPV